MSARALFHDSPERLGHPHYDVDLVSPEVPSGAAWLANCLLELGVSVWKPWGSDDRAHWLSLGGLRHRYVGGDNGWSRVLPALRDGREFAFRAQPCVRAHHAWPNAHPATRLTLLFVRDPRDALYSAWQRSRRLDAIPPEQDFVAFCSSPFFHFPISRQDHLLLFLRVWRRALDSATGHVTRFEDYRRDPIGTLLAAQRHAGIDASSQAVQAAVAASSVERLKVEDRRLQEIGVVPSTIVRGEPPGEYQRHCDDEAQRRVGSRFGDICAWLGYTPPAAAEAERRLHSREQVHAGILSALGKTGVCIDSAGWLASAIFDCAADIDFATSASTG
ncbi:MAG: sulfotransferase domain-containing protein [Dokdonella sp.]